jgi:hypothetical protein
MQVRILLGAPILWNSNTGGVRILLHGKQRGISDNGSTLVLHSGSRGSTPLFSTSSRERCDLMSRDRADGTRNCLLYTSVAEDL